MGNNKKEIGSRIKSIRISQGLSMEEFGKKFEPKATKGTVSNWENGNYLPNNERLKRISEIGQVSMLYLLEGKYMLSDIHMMSDDQKENFLNDFGKPILTDDFSDKRFKQAAKRFSEFIGDKNIKTEMAILLDALIDIKENKIPKDQLEKEINDISLYLAKLPFKLLNKN